MAIKLSSTKVDLSKESSADGEWKDSLRYPDVKYKVRSLRFPPYRKAREKLGFIWARKYGAQGAPDEVNAKEIGRLFAEHILLDWAGFDEPYAKADAQKTLTDPEYRDVVSDIEFAAGQVASADVEFIEEAAKNSEQPSATS